MPDYNLKETQTLEYKRIDVVKGYTDQTLYINLSDPQIDIKPVAEETKKTFIGGKGYDLWLLWNASGYWLLVTGYWLLVTGYWLLFKVSKLSLYI